MVDFSVHGSWSKTLHLYFYASQDFTLKYIANILGTSTSFECWLLELTRYILDQCDKFWWEQNLMTQSLWIYQGCNDDHHAQGINKFFKTVPCICVPWPTPKCISSWHANNDQDVLQKCACKGQTVNMLEYVLSISSCYAPEYLINEHLVWQW